MKTLILTVTLATTLTSLLTDAARAQSSAGKAEGAHKPLSAVASDPGQMGWMQGFPPPAGKVISNTETDFIAFPKLRWTMCHFRELLPTASVPHGPKASRRLERAIDPGLDAVMFTPLHSKRTMTWREAFDANYTDGIMVLHHGKVVYERYAGCLKEGGVHGAMSVTKSLTGLLAETLIAEGRLNPDAKVLTLVPELKDSAFGDAAVRQVLDMETALAYSEDYADPNAEIWGYAAATSGLPRPKDDSGPNGTYAYLETMKAKRKAGEAFDYQSPNADVAGWIIARVTGKSVADLLSERIWSRIGAEREAYYTVDSEGTPSAAGGFSGALGDMARVGQMMLDNGKVNGEQIVPAEAVVRIAAGGDKARFAKSDHSELPGWSYRGLWWHTGSSAYAARGIYGQTIYIDPDAGIVIARFASYPAASNAHNDPTSLPAYQAVANYLKSQSR